MRHHAKKALENIDKGAPDASSKCKLQDDRGTFEPLLPFLCERVELRAARSLLPFLHTCPKIVSRSIRMPAVEPPKAAIPMQITAANTVRISSWVRSGFTSAVRETKNNANAPVESDVNILRYSNADLRDRS